MVVGDVTGPGRARAGHVIVRPERVGICGSDFHLFSGDVGALSGSRDFYPRIQGHEVSAIVADPGDGEAAAGERVAILPLLPCGRCYPCRIGRPNVCPAFRLVGVHLDGGLAERLEVPAGLVFGAGGTKATAALAYSAEIRVDSTLVGRSGPTVPITFFAPRGAAIPRQDTTAIWILHRRVLWHLKECAERQSVTSTACPSDNGLALDSNSDIRPLAEWPRLRALVGALGLEAGRH